MPYSTVKVIAPRTNPNAKWLVWSPTFNDLVHSTDIPLETRDYVTANNGVQYFAADVTVTPIKWGGVVATGGLAIYAAYYALRHGGQLPPEMNITKGQQK